MSQSADVFVFLDVYAQEGGIQTYNRLLLHSYASLEKPPAQVFVLRDRDADPNPLASHPAFKFHNFYTSSPQRSRLNLALALWQQFRQQRPQQVICGHVNLAPLLDWLCRPWGIPYSAILHGKEVWQPLPWWKRKALQGAERIWIVSCYSRDRACAANHLDPKKVQLLPNAVDGKRFTPGPKPVDLLNKYDFEGCRVLMTVARLWSGDPYKGVDVTLRALPKILAECPDVKYLVVGRGDDQPRLERLVQELGLQERVVFAGFVPTAALIEHYRVADAYIMPSQEGFGIVYLEAMACGLPVLAGDDDGSADPLQEGRLGWRVPHRDVDAVAAACLEILQGKDSRCNGQWLREETLKQFSYEAFQARLQQLLEDCQ
ncbi:MAG: glycosyltransferase [Chloroflexaceae bacterium]|nr:glycosyltransferase [Chloroflexaceae bacterium]